MATPRRNPPAPRPLGPVPDNGDPAVRDGDEWARMVVLCAANNWDDVRLSDRPLAEELAKLAPVLYVDPPTSHLAVRHNPRVAPALRRPRLRLEAPRLARLTPVVTPVPFRGPVTAVTRRIAGSRARPASRSRSWAASSSASVGRPGQDR